MPEIAPDPHALLCEHCGYPLDGFSQEAPCPECATPVRESLPQRRVGTAWQRGPSTRAFVRTAWETLRHPRRTFRTLRVSGVRPAGRLLAIYFTLAVLPALAMWIILLSNGDFRTRFWYVRAGVGGGVAASTEAFTVPGSWNEIVAGIYGFVFGQFVLTVIETMGVQFFGRKRQWRVTGPIAWSVCSHAAVGWAIGGLLYAVSPWVVMAARPLYDLFPPVMAVRIANEGARWVPIAGLFAGMLYFESLVYLGIRECRFANIPKARPPTPPPPPDATGLA